MSSSVAQENSSSDTAEDAPPSLTPLSTQFEIALTEYGGRGCFALQRIPKGTTILECSRPLGFSINKDFKKEVCNWCYKYDNGRTMKERLSSKNGKFSVNFCCQQCAADFKEYDDTGLLLNTLLLIESLPVAECEPGSVTKLNREIIDSTWDEAQEWEASLPAKLTKRQKFLPRFIDEDIYVELRYLATILFELQKGTSSELEYFYQLQSNEYEKTIKYPQMLRTSRKIFEIAKILFPHEFQPFITTDFVRSTLGKESGNAFGIWSPQTNNEYQEYLGFALYPSASFFNHSCEPNLRKSREKNRLVFRTIKDIEPYEEMYINYGSTTEESFEVRQASLKEWFFDCQCSQCKLDEIKLHTAGLKL